MTHGIALIRALTPYLEDEKPRQRTPVTDAGKHHTWADFRVGGLPVWCCAIAAMDWAAGIFVREPDPDHFPCGCFKKGGSMSVSALLVNPSPTREP
jgi:hypothetical protein